jgi:hypothetical protein
MFISDCAPFTHEVQITLLVPMSQSDFTKDKQAAFKASLAQTAGVASEAVVINKIESISSRRHLLAEAIRVETSIMSAGEAAAQELAGRLTPDTINRDLFKAGLPTATVLKAATPALKSSITSPGLSASNSGTVAVAAGTSEASRSSFFSTPVLVGRILGIVFLAGTVVCFCRWKCKNPVVAASHATQIPATVEMGFPTTSLNEVRVFHDVEAASALPLKKVQESGEGPCHVQTNQVQDQEVEAPVPHIRYSERESDDDDDEGPRAPTVKPGRVTQALREVGLLERDRVERDKARLQVLVGWCSAIHAVIDSSTARYRG